MIDSFVLSGRAKTVFRTIELKAKREAELNILLKTRSCRYSNTAVCSKPDNITCEKFRCPVWKEIDGE